MVCLLQPRLIHLRGTCSQRGEFRNRSKRGGAKKISAPDENGVRLVLPLGSSILAEISGLLCNKCSLGKALLSIL
jgi:hypothetical protein